MKVLFIESQFKAQNLDINPKVFLNLPKNIFLAYSIQYKPIAERVRDILIEQKINIVSFRQVFGCSKIKTSYPILFIGSGMFHLSNFFNYSDNIYIFENNFLKKIDKSSIENYRAKRKSALLRFLSAENIGIIVSTKSGQSNLKLAYDIQKRLDKPSYIFLTNNIDIAQFENFFIDSWINTACSGLILDSQKIINPEEIENLIKK